MNYDNQWSDVGVGAVVIQLIVIIIRSLTNHQNKGDNININNRKTTMNNVLSLINHYLIHYLQRFNEIIDLLLLDQFTY